MPRVATLFPGLPTDFYAPDFRVEVEGQELDATSKGDVLDVKIDMELDKLTHFDLTFNNWDDRLLKYKYSDTDRLDVGRRVEVFLGYAGRLLSMVRGIITSLTPRFPESGSPTIAVSGQDLLFLLQDSKPKENDAVTFDSVADWQIAQKLAERHGLKSVVTKEGPLYDRVIQKNQDDAVFLMERAKRIDFDLFIRTDPATGEDALHFVKPTDGRDGSAGPVYEFARGKSLIEFSPTLSLSGQVSKLTVRGWDFANKKEIVATADAADLPAAPGGGASGPSLVARLLQAAGGKEDRVVDAPVTTQEEAKQLAVSMLREKAYEFITGSARVIGVPDLRPGDNVLLSGLGKRFSGTYYVKKVSHALGGSGYMTSFEVRKYVDGGTQ
jgi:phage protein D